ncbi:MAG: hypothetical protein U0165_02315 [Polyangiaceae bacterium]
MIAAICTRTVSEISLNIERTIQLVFDLDVVSAEETGDTTQLIQETRLVLGEVLAVLSPLAEGQLPSEITGAAEVGEVAFEDLVFLGYMGLSAKLSSLGANLDSCETWDIFDLCAGTRREALRSLCAIGNHLRRVLGGPSYDEYLYDEAIVGVETRRAYLRFREEIIRFEPVSVSDCSGSMRRCASAIAKLIGKPIYPFLRTQDRLLLRDAQRRLRAWLEAQRHEADLLGASRIWQDLFNQCEIMLAVNMRPELREHDRRTLAKAKRWIRANPDKNLLEVAALLSTAQGRCPRLDACLSSTGTTHAELIAAIDGCLVALDQNRADADKISTWAPPSEGSPASAKLRIR